MFRPVDSRVNFPALEERILLFWKEHDVFRKSLELREGRPSFVLYEGPPTANGSPGIHHVLARVFKDIIPRYKTMKGYYCPRKAGWDCHGLPVELEVEKELGISTKPQIESYGVDKFNARCRESVFRYLKDWEYLTERIAFWIDMEHPYITMENYYIESCWWILKQLWERDLLYLGHKVTPHCPRCVTSLSSHEVALGYKDDAVDPSIYVKFKFVPGGKGGLESLFLEKGPVYFLAWTTTPWTLPANTGLAVAPDAEYALVDMGEERLVLATGLIYKAGVVGEVVARFSGRELVGLSYEPLFPPGDYGVEVLKFDGGRLERASQPPVAFQIIPADFVSLDEGTGIVHTAPSFGEVDYEAGKEQGLFFLQPVNLEGIITGSYPFSGRFVKDADPLIVEDLERRGLIFRKETITHTYPFCWRCDSPLLYYAKRSWYIRTTAVKDVLIKGNEEINWYPEHIKHGRFGEWLENNVDWALSRERYWGTPLPIWQCRECGRYECIGGFEELKSRPGLIGWRDGMDVHRPYIDEVRFRCPCGGEMTRVPDVLDCWFDSGAMPVAQWHYPFENRELFRKYFPADYICEAVDQTRGWFYTLHAISSLVFGRPCFKNVISLGHILDAKGEKMSKAKGNVVEPGAIIEKYGADALRWYMFTAAPPGNVRRFDPEQVLQVVRRFLLTLWNTYSFFVTYANLDRFDPRSTPPEFRTDLDRWLISRLNQLIEEVTFEMDNYDPTTAARKLEAFVDELSNWYVRRSRRRFWKSESDEDKLAAYFTLYDCLVTLTKLLAPFIPFVAEELYQNLVRSHFPEAPLSVHLCDFPEPRPELIDEALVEDVRLVRRLCSLGRAARSRAGIKVRQPLSRALIRVRYPEEAKGVKRLEDQILDELNVKVVEFVERLLPEGLPYAEEVGYLVALDPTLTPELIAEGLSREIVHRIQNMRRSAGFEISDHIITYYRSEGLLSQVMEEYADYIKQETLSEELVPDVPEDAYREEHKLKEGTILLGVRKVQ